MNKRTILALCFSLVLSGCTQRTVPETSKPINEEVNLILDTPEILNCDIIIKTETFDKYKEIPLSPKLQDDVIAACKEFDISPDIVYAVMEVESAYQVDAENGDCIGLMQISTINVPYLLEKIGVMNLHNPTDNIRSGAYILSEALSKYSLTESLMVYNNGETGARKLWNQGIYETDYTRKVIDAIKGDK